MDDIVVANAVRTALGDFGGALKGVQAVDLAQAVIKKSDRVGKPVLVH